MQENMTLLIRQKCDSQHVSQVAVLLQSSATIKSFIVPEGSSATKDSFAKHFYQGTTSTFKHL